MLFNVSRTSDVMCMLLHPEACHCAQSQQIFAQSGHIEGVQFESITGELIGSSPELREGGLPLCASVERPRLERRKLKRAPIVKLPIDRLNHADLAGVRKSIPKERESRWRQPAAENSA